MSMKKEQLSAAVPVQCEPPKAGRRYTCSVEAALDVIGGKWKGIIVFHLLTGSPRRFNEFRRLMPMITQRMLTLQLRELEQDGIVHREVYREVPPRVEYSLTPFGLTLKPIILQVWEWGKTYEARLAEQEQALSPNALNSARSESNQ